MLHELPSPADIVRQSAATVRRIAEAARRRGDVRFAEALEQRAAVSEQRAFYLDDIAHLRATLGDLLERQLIAEHEAVVRALEES